ncbi:MAG TPA: uroporphyrinogen-III C-methyltransferase [Cytophagales bacterium]|jgi:uroporphyrin-III C-methyltransferase|nr:uroporphyrinogen-III C-methyltransferase [Cytophagales bacterium]
MTKSITLSKVVLAGAGPGDPDLITVKAFRYLTTADVLVVDRLVDHSLLNYAKLGVKIFFVGKEGGNPNSFTQENINQLLVSEAKSGKLVLRLKGGDVSFFSNIFSELETLVENHIPYEIIPGVTSASGAAACAGIPLTARNYSNSVRFLSYTHPETIDEQQMNELARTEDTLVFFMAAKNVRQLVGSLVAQDITSDKWIAVIEEATTPNQRVTVLPISSFTETTRDIKFRSPAMIIIGKVSQLHHRFHWVTNEDKDSSFFPSIDQTILKTKVA